jgi:hypothetical protein
VLTYLGALALAAVAGIGWNVYTWLT